MVENRTIYLGEIAIKVDTYRETFMDKPQVRSFATAEVGGKECMWVVDSEHLTDDEVDSRFRAALQRELDRHSTPLMEITNATT